MRDIDESIIIIHQGLKMLIKKTSRAQASSLLTSWGWTIGEVTELGEDFHPAIMTELEFSAAFCPEATAQAITKLITVALIIRIRKGV